MLILTRRTGEKLIIGDDIEIAVFNVKGNQTRFGINTLENISAHCEEIYQHMQDKKLNQQETL